MINVPNVVTTIRVALALLVAGLLFMPDERMRWICFVLTILVIWGDGLDGYLARKLKQTTKFGAMLDIAGDRIVEMVYWIIFAVLGWLPAWIPILFLVRGTVVDLVRARANEQGYTAFGKSTMMQTGIGKFIVSSNFSRFTYAVVKAVAFCLVIVAHTQCAGSPAIINVSLWCAYGAAVLCVLRGLPVMMEGWRFFSNAI